MGMAPDTYRLAFSDWLRTGRWPIATLSTDVELKFNPYHDPRNGQFTFAPGGPRSLRHVIVSHRRRNSPLTAQPAPGSAISTRGDLIGQGDARIQDAIYRPDAPDGLIMAASFPRVPRPTRGNNAGAFHDPMTLQQAIPSLQGGPGGAIIALADNLFDITGPAQELTAQMARDWSNQMINQIQAIDPGYRFDSLGFPQTAEGQMNQLNRLRFDRAATFLRVRNEVRPLQVETMRFMQETADFSYARGLKLLRAGRLKVRLSEQEALGNFIDREVRGELRRRYDRYGIDSAGRGPVRVNRRENDSSGSEASFRRPDARVGNIAYDVTLTQKTLKTPQVRGFFGADFRPSHVIIIRPRQIGPHSSYIISRPETKR